MRSCRRLWILFADRILVVSKGDTMDVGDAHFECLYSPNPELHMNVTNNASLVLKMTLGGKTVMWLGDAGVVVALINFL